jgi:hypothetical protein
MKDLRSTLESLLGPRRPEVDAAKEVLEWDEPASLRIARNGLRQQPATVRFLPLSQPRPTRH